MFNKFAISALVAATAANGMSTFPISLHFASYEASAITKYLII